MDRTRSASPPASLRRHSRHTKERAVIIMGATGSGKSKLSVDLATRFFPSEIINSDKIQVYKGLDITTNKIPPHERLGVPHHLLGDFEPDTDFSASDFRSIASSLIAQIASRGKLPLVVGGSNSFIHALVAERFDPKSDVFLGPNTEPIPPDCRYDCCFLWIDVELPVLFEYLGRRVDEMLELGMLDELAEYYDPAMEGNSVGLRKAIGVPEFDRYLSKYGADGGEENVDVMERTKCYEGAVRAVKENTCQLVKRQIGKIMRLRDSGWNIKRLDATEAFRAALDSGKKGSEAWERRVLGPSVKIVKRFLGE